MWAHITLIYPFRETARIDDGTIDEIERLLDSFASFDFTLTTVEYFSSPPVVLYLAPSRQDPSRN
jgi:2'-5' RNA ligase